HLVPETEAHPDKQWGQGKVLQRLHARQAHQLRQVGALPGGVGGGEGGGALPRHGGGKPQEVVVVGHVAQGIDPGGGAAGGEVEVVGLHGVLVDQGRIVPAAHPGVDVGGHVHQVAGAGDQAPAPIRRGGGPLGIGGGLHRVDVEVQGAGVGVVAGQDPLQAGDDL